MQLILVNAEMASVYGLPPKDLDEEAALQLVSEFHLECAIQAGAFRRAEDNKPMIDEVNP